ncbi:MAG: methyltransferase [Candidatus Lokiarchaeota archaeon]|nr:methyltransferase [Candidatus Lokiarchaeota archaeon]
MKEKMPDPIIHNPFEDVYSPSDDSFLILDFIRSKISQEFFDEIPIREIENILDLGTGTGIVAIFLELLNMFPSKIYASDILQNAIKCAQINEKRNNIDNKINYIHSNLFESFPNHLKDSFEIIIFNPPYLPSIKRIERKRIDYLWDGGIDGLKVLSKFFSQVERYLNHQKKCHIYYICSSNTNLDELYKFIDENGFKNEVLLNRHIFFEDIFLNRATLK